MADLDIPLRLELVPLPVSDVDRAKAFYVDTLGFHLDVDHAVPGFRIVQVTPPGSACSLSFGVGIVPPDTPPVTGLHLVVTDVVATREALVARGATVSAVRHVGPAGWGDGPDPEHRDFQTYADLADPDGNTFVLQEKGHPDAAGPPVPPT